MHRVFQRVAGHRARWYLHRFGGESPFRRRGLDIKSVAMVGMGGGYLATAKATLPKHWRGHSPHTHVALDGAIEQGELIFNVLRELNVQRGDTSMALPTPRDAEQRERFERRRRTRGRRTR